MRTLYLSAVVAASVGLAACAPDTAPPPPPPALAMSCPASIATSAPDNIAVPVSFSPPTVTGGQAPVSTACTAQSGAAFPLGSTLVTCTSTDASSRQAACTFNVTVSATPRIAKTRFLAIGDSLTYGRCGPNPPAASCTPYTERLLQLLQARYTRQTLVMFNRGVRGQRATEAEDQFAEELAMHNPDVVLLMSGTNDLLRNPTALDEAEALESLEDMIRMARERSATNTSVFLATIPPIAPGGPYNHVVSRVAPFNVKVRELATRMSVPLVDIHAVLNADVQRYYVGDDVHPTAEAHVAMGDAFFAAIRSALDATPPSAGGMFLTSSPGSFGTRRSRD